MSAVHGEYKGAPTLSLSPDDGTTPSRFPFTFGLAKAQLILANLPAIQQFVAMHKPASEPLGTEADPTPYAQAVGWTGGAE